MFALRLVTLDYYMDTPSAPLDPLVSKLGGWEVWQVPVVRIFGVTPAGQKACLHVHGAMPYLTVPCVESRPERFAVVLASEIDLLLNTAAGRATSMHRHVHHVAVIRATHLYGFHDREETFLRIFLYNPLHVAKVAELLLSGLVQKRVMQPHEAHIPFALQFMVDHNLHGMSFVRVECFKFRRPTTWIQDKGKALGDGLWDLNSLPVELFGSMEKQTMCELELDCCARDILNTSDKEGLNPGLAALWQEEEERRQEPVRWTPLSIEDEGFPCTESEQFYLARLDKRLARQAVDEQDRTGTRETRRKHHSHLLDTSHGVLDSQDEALAEALAQAASSWTQEADKEEDSILGSLPSPDIEVAEDDEDNAEDMSQVFQLVGDGEQDDDGASSMSDQSDGNEAYDPFQLDGADDLPGGAALKGASTRDQGTQTGARPPVLVRRLLGRARMRRCTRLSLRRQQQQQATQERQQRERLLGVVSAAAGAEGQSLASFRATPPVAEDWQRWQSCHVASLLTSPPGSCSTPSSLTAGSPASELSQRHAYAPNASPLEAVLPCCVELLRLTEAEIEHWQQRTPPFQKVHPKRMLRQEQELHLQSPHGVEDMPKPRKRHKKRGCSADSSAGNMVLRSRSPVAEGVGLREPTSSHAEGCFGLENFAGKAGHRALRACRGAGEGSSKLVPGTESASKRPKTYTDVTGSVVSKRASKGRTRMHLAGRGEGTDSLQRPLSVSPVVGSPADGEVSLKKQRSCRGRKLSPKCHLVAGAGSVSTASTLSSAASSVSTSRGVGGLCKLKASECRPSVICRVRIRGKHVISTTTTRLVPCVASPENDGRSNAHGTINGPDSCETDSLLSTTGAGISTPLPLKPEAGGDSELPSRSNLVENDGPKLSKGKALRRLAQNKLSPPGTFDASIDASISDLVNHFSRCGVGATSTAGSEATGSSDNTKCDLFETGNADNKASSVDETSTKKEVVIAKPATSDLMGSATPHKSATTEKGNMLQMLSNPSASAKPVLKPGRPRKIGMSGHPGGNKSSGGNDTDVLSNCSLAGRENMPQPVGRRGRWRAAKLSSSRPGVRRSSRLEAVASASCHQATGFKKANLSSPHEPVSRHAWTEEENPSEHFSTCQSTDAEDVSSTKLLPGSTCSEATDSSMLSVDSLVTKGIVIPELSVNALAPGGKSSRVPTSVVLRGARNAGAVVMRQELQAASSGELSCSQVLGTREPSPDLITNSEFKGATRIAAGKLTPKKKKKVEASSATPIIDEESFSSDVGTGDKTRKSVSGPIAQSGLSKALSLSALGTRSLSSSRKINVCTPNDADGTITHEPLKPRAKLSTTSRKQEAASPSMCLSRLRTRSGIQKVKVMRPSVLSSSGVADEKQGAAVEFPATLSRDEAGESQESLCSSLGMFHKESALKRGRCSKVQDKCSTDVRKRTSKLVSEALIPDLTDADVLLSGGSDNRRSVSPCLAKAHNQPNVEACIDAEEGKQSVQQTGQSKANSAASDVVMCGSQASAPMPATEPTTSEEAVVNASLYSSCVKAGDKRALEEGAAVDIGSPIKGNCYLSEIYTRPLATKPDVAEFAGSGTPLSGLPSSSNSENKKVGSPMVCQSAENLLNIAVDNDIVGSLSSESSDAVSKLSSIAEHADKHSHQASKDFELTEPSIHEGAVGCADLGTDVLRNSDLTSVHSSPSRAEANKIACSEQQPEAELLTGNLTDDTEVADVESAGTGQRSASTPGDSDCLHLSSDEGDWILLDEAGDDSIELFSSSDEMVADWSAEPASSEGCKEHVNGEDGIGDMSKDDVSSENLVSYGSSESSTHSDIDSQSCAEDVSRGQDDNRQTCLEDIREDNCVDISDCKLVGNTSSEVPPCVKHMAEIDTVTCAMADSSESSSALGSKHYADISPGDFVQDFSSKSAVGDISCENEAFIASENFIVDVDLEDSEELLGEVNSNPKQQEDSTAVFTAKSVKVTITRLDDVDVHSDLGGLYLKAKQALKSLHRSKTEPEDPLGSNQKSKRRLYHSGTLQIGTVDQDSAKLAEKKSGKQHCKERFKSEKLQMSTADQDVAGPLSTREHDKKHERRLNASEAEQTDKVEQDSSLFPSSTNADQQHSIGRLDSERLQTGKGDRACADPVSTRKPETQHEKRFDTSEPHESSLVDQDSTKFPLLRKFYKENSKRRLDLEGLQAGMVDQQSVESTRKSEKQPKERSLYSETHQAGLMVQDSAKSSPEKLSLPPADMTKVPGLLEQVLDLGELPDALKCLWDAEVPLPELDADCFNLPHEPVRWLPDDGTVEKQNERPPLKGDPPFCPSDDSMLGDLTKACSLTNEGLVVLVPAVPPPACGAQLSNSSSYVARARKKPKSLALWQKTKLEAFARDSCFEVDFDHNPELRIAFCRDRTVVLTPARCPPTNALLALVRQSPPSPEDDGASTHEPLLSEASSEPVTPTATPPRHETSTSQLDGPTARFALSGARISADTERVLTVLSVEVHVRTRGDLWPDPERDSIQCLLWCARGHGADAPVEVGTMHWALHDPRMPDVEDLVAVSLRRTGVAGPGLHTQVVRSERDLFMALIDLVHRWDPDVLLGYDAQRASWGYLCERAEHLEVDLYARLSRAPPPPGRKEFVGRILLSVWRILRKEVTLNIYTFENAYYHVMHRRVPLFSFRTLSEWFTQDLFRWRVVEHYVVRARGNLELLDELNVFGKTSQMASIFGIQFLEVLSRGSQFRVESMLLRLVRGHRMVALSPSTAQRARQRAPEFIPLVLEPRAQFYTDPVVVLDFQSLYPSVIIAHNYCFSTCLGRVDTMGSVSPFGCSTLEVPLTFARSLRDHITVSPAGVAFVRPSIRRGLLPQMLDEVLGTRLMVKQAMSRCTDKALRRVLDAQQLSLKLIANVTYGYTAASFSGRMPCVEVADSVVSKGREALERAIRTAEATVPGSRVIYGDTDSLFVLLEGRSRKEAFRLGQEIADRVTAQNPRPMRLRMEKVYQPCVLQTKKRYVGFAYEHPDQQEPKYDAKGIETVRRDTCPAVAKLLEKMLRVLFTSHDVSAVKRFVKLQFSKILAERVSPQDFIFAREFRGLHGYQPSACVPALEIARRLVRCDPRAEPLVGERVPYVVVYGHPGQRLIELVRQPHELLTSHSQLRLNAHYYVGRVIGPALNRVLRLMGANCLQWYEELPRPRFVNPRPGTMAAYLVVGQLCLACGGQSESRQLCTSCEADPSHAALVLGGKVQRVQKALLELQAVCHSCMGFQASGTCMSTDCPVLYKTARVTAEAKKALDWNDARNVTSSSS